MTSTFQTTRSELRRNILNVTENTFSETALGVFQFQATHNPIYRSYLNHLGCNPSEIKSIDKIPFLPIEFFKSHTILTGDQTPVQLFESSGTTGSITSKHFLCDADLYNEISTTIFQSLYGPLSNFHILALLPSYLERATSSLVFMVDDFIRKTRSSYSGFYLKNTTELMQRIEEIAALKDGKKVLIIGVTFGLLDWIDEAPDFSVFNQVSEVIVMETGGMKGRRVELLREQVHELLKAAMPISAVHSEYGMTELISQAYATKEGWFTNSKTLQVLIRDTTDPFHIYPNGNITGGINVIDLGNLDSCSFIETQDLGRYNEQKDQFQILGRFDNSDTRGCNLMIST